MPFVYKLNDKIKASQAKRISRQANKKLNREESAQPNKIIKYFNKRKLYKMINIYNRFLTDIIFCVSDRATQMAVKVREILRADYKIYSYHSDLAINYGYVNPMVDGYYVGSEMVKAALLKYNIPENKIKVTNMPPFSLADVDKKSLKAEMGIDENMPVILISGGAYGYKHLVPHFKAVLSLSTTYKIIVNLGTGTAFLFKKAIREIKKYNKIYEKIKVFYPYKVRYSSPIPLDESNIIYYRNKDTHINTSVADIVITTSSMNEIYKYLVAYIPTIAVSPFLYREKYMVNEMQLNKLLYYSSSGNFTLSLIKDKYNPINIDKHSIELKDKIIKQLNSSEVIKIESSIENNE